MPCHPSEPEFAVRDIPSLRGYIAIVTGGKSSSISFTNRKLTTQETLELALKQHSNSPSRAPESTSPLAPPSALAKPSQKCTNKVPI